MQLYNATIFNQTMTLLGLNWLKSSMQILYITQYNKMSLFVYQMFLSHYREKYKWIEVD